MKEEKIDKDEDEDEAICMFSQGNVETAQKSMEHEPIKKDYKAKGL